MKPSVSVIFGVLNEEHRLPGALRSVRSQDYPQDLVEIIVADGGSTDATLQIAKEWNCRVIHNPLRRCEPGIALGFEAAKNDIIIVMAADNAFDDANFLAEIVRPFADERILAALPQVVSTSEDSLTTRYLNTFTDPFNMFLYGDACNPQMYHHAYRALDKNDHYVVYDFERHRLPLAALAQGTAIRRSFDRLRHSHEDDVAPLTAIIEEGGRIAYVPNARVQHHTVGGLRDFLKKFGPRITKRLESRDEPVWERSAQWSIGRRIRAYLWPVYALSFVAPTAMALLGAVRDRRAVWLYHPIVTFALGSEFARRVISHHARVVLRRLRTAPQ